ncbi:hypothetical protein SUGI_0239480 [Cryptomeria japonica]|uniref:tetraspanin-8 n=1 Tax=Cryptomeria japonica TaxID=3369 RepID=UPI002408C759|nr:tetraspanin-8 [Cryptomeria japonica]GLJ14766.1 hypothetical protein SUGI_0239480 [Cryptomeria japonica]
MARFSNKILGLLNFAAFVVSIPVLGGGVWLATKADTDCEKFLQWPAIAIGGALMAVSLAGWVGAWGRITCLLWFYLTVMFILIVLLFCFTVFAYVVTNKGAGRTVSGRGYKEYRLGDYSNWLQKRVTKTSNWNKIKSCIKDAKVCKKLADETIGDDAQKFYEKKLSPIESGCCKPPSSCNFVYVNATAWTPSTTSSADTECTKWSNVQNQLCYNCNSCKAGVVANLKNNWRKISFISFAVLIALIVVYSVGCCAFRNSRNDELHDYKGYS